MCTAQETAAPPREIGHMMMRTRTGQMRPVTHATFRSDPLFPRIEHVIGTILEKGKVVTPIDVLVGMQLLKPENLEQWRRGRVPYLERLITCNLDSLRTVTSFGTDAWVSAWGSPVAENRSTCRLRDPERSRARRDRLRA